MTNFLRTFSAFILIATMAVFSLHCGKSSQDETKSSGAVINGAGATFPYPIYAQWAHKYESTTKVRLNYQSIGSGGGVAQIKAKTVDFGASDAPLTPDELNETGLLQFPMVIGGVVPVYNLQNIASGSIKLSAQLLADIFLGKVNKWNDASIKELNPSVNLPDKDITVVQRADGSGTTWIFTNYLDKVSPGWHDKVGYGKAVSWPVGVGGKGNEGVAAYVQRVDGALGYVEYAYALQNKMNHVLMENKEGNYVAPTSTSFQAAAANADWKNAPGYYLVLTNQPGAESWPISGASFILMHKEQANPATAKIVLEFFKWCYEHGGTMAESLHYVPIPENVVSLIEKTWSDEMKSQGHTIWE